MHIWVGIVGFSILPQKEKKRERERKIGREKKKSAAACGTLHPYDDDNPLIV